VKLEDFRGRWLGETTVCIASGPSLTVEDCERVRESGLRCIVTNLTFRRAPWADALYAMDAVWWTEYKDEVLATFKGLRFALMPYAPDVIATKARLYPPGHGQSGSYAISAAIVLGAPKILMLGYDCKPDAAGRKHWHEDYPSKMGNAASIKRWPYQFQMMATYAQSRGVKIINCTRDTALTCFERGTLEEELAR